MFKDLKGKPIQIGDTAIKLQILKLEGKPSGFGIVVGMSLTY